MAHNILRLEETNMAKEFLECLNKIRHQDMDKLNPETMLAEQKSGRRRREGYNHELDRVRTGKDENSHINYEELHEHLQIRWFPSIFVPGSGTMGESNEGKS